MRHPSELLHVPVIDGGLLAHQSPYAEFREELEAPAGNGDVVAVASIGKGVIEDGFDGFGRLAEDGFGADVDSVVGVGGEEVRARATKGRITDAE